MAKTKRQYEVHFEAPDATAGTSFRVEAADPAAARALALEWPDRGDWVVTKTELVRRTRATSKGSTP